MFPRGTIEGRPVNSHDRNGATFTDGVDRPLHSRRGAPLKRNRNAGEVLKVIVHCGGADGIDADEFVAESLTDAVIGHHSVIKMKI